MPCAVEFIERAAEQFLLEVGVIARKFVEITAIEDAHFRIGHRGDAVRAFLAERAADEIRRKNDADDLLAPVGGRDDQFEHAFEDIGDHRCVVAFPEQRLARLDALLAPHLAEQQQLLGIEARTDRAVSHDAGCTVGHAVRLAECAAFGNSESFRSGWMKRRRGIPEIRASGVPVTQDDTPIAPLVT